MSEEKTEIESGEEEVRATTNPVMSELSEAIDPNRVSDVLIERVAYSGDPSALPQYHYRWKRKYLADYVVRVNSIEELQTVLRVASKHKVPIVPRGGASSCLGSSSPSRGGIALDMKQMDKVLQITDDFAVVQAGVPFERLDQELAKKGLMLGIYPSSAKSAVIGGWIACGGKAGIGTPVYGTLADNILELTVVKADGSIVKMTGDDIHLFNGSYGILGIIAEAKVKVRRIPSKFRTLSFAFVRIRDMITAMEMMIVERTPTYLKIADSGFQSYSNPIDDGKYLLTVTYEEQEEPLSVEDLMDIASNKGGVFLGEEFSDKEWNLRYDCEFNPKEHTETLMFQELYLDTKHVTTILEKYESYKKSHKVPALWYGMLGTPEKMRVELMAMLDAEQYLKFISSKGVLHKMMKRAIALGGGPYTIGLQNSIYMARAYPERLVAMSAAKKDWDPDNIMNPDRVTSCMTSYARMNVLFGMAAAIRRVARYFGRS